MCLNDLTSKLTPRQMEIAIEAIGRRATGSPTEVALQILQGIAVLDGGGAPAVAWPEDYSLLDKAKWHAEQAKRCQETHEWIENLNRERDARLSEHPPFPKHPDQPEQAQSPAPVRQVREAHHGAPTEAAHESGKKPDQGASDASE